MKVYILLLCTVMSVVAFGQDTLTISGYLETYYVYDFNKPSNHFRPSYVYSHNRHNEINLNIGFVRAAYSSDRVRANLALMAGTYANANLASEPGVLKNVFEANAGIKISTSSDVWLDVGILPSHIGFESAVGKDCWNLTRSILAENSPYYEAGARISFTSADGKWYLTGLLLNGWQRIQRVDGNSLPSFGTQVSFKPNASVTLNSSTFIGTNKPDSVRQMRYFHNFYGIFQLTDKVGLTLGFDYGLEEKGATITRTNSWFSPVVIAKIGLTPRASFAVRGEYYDDRHGVIISSGGPDGFRATGVSANFDYLILPNAMWRIEARRFSSDDEIFTDDNGQRKSDTFVSTALAISF